jgi:four helix bundle protein
LNIAAGNGKGANADRCRFFEIARGSALECGSIQDCLEVCGVLTAAENAQGKTMLIRIVSMLTKLGQRNCEVQENPGRSDHLDYDNDNGTKDSR